MPVEVLNHTADIRIRVTERDKKLLYLKLGNAMLSLIFHGNHNKCEYFFQREFEVKNAVSFLNDVLYVVDTENKVLKIKYLRFCGSKVLVGFCGEEFQYGEHSYHYLIKAVTYHNFVETENLAEVTFDI